MNRLTCKPDKIMKNYYYETTKKTISKDRIAILNKLGQLEDIEEEIGIDLITLYKCFKSTKFYIKNLFGEIIEVKSDIIRFDIGNGYVYFGADYCSLSDYGKTWALTKEELL